MSAAQTIASMLDAAMWWAARGFSVFPVYEMAGSRCACGQVACEAAGKHPRLPRWQILATTEERQIREWWARWPKANIGIACGRELVGGGYLLVVDVDPRHDGDMHLGLLEQRHGELPETPRNNTGGGGQHIFLRSRVQVRSRANSLGPGVDVKCRGGYILAPPSNHASGQRYMRDSGADVADVPIADAPEWLVTLADPPEVKSRVEVPDAFIEGGRHDAMVSLAGTLRRRGLSGAEMLPTMLAVNSMRCRPALDEDEVKRIAYSARWDAGDPIAPGSDPWNLMRAEAIFAPLPPYPWLVKGLHLAPGRITLLSGAPDTGKTVVAMSVALAVASGRDVWGVYKPAKKGKVLHLNGEIGSYIARERYQRLARGMGIEPGELADTLVLSNYPDAKLDDPDFEERLRVACEGCALVVIDSLRAFSGSLDERDKEIGVAILMLARVSDQTGAVILVLHHNRKPSKDDAGRAADAISGSNSIFGGCECAYVMSKEKGGPVLVKHERSPLGRPMEDFGLAIEDVEGDDRDPRWGLRVRHMDGEEMAREAEDAKAAKLAAVERDIEETVLAFLTRHAGAFIGSRDRLREAAGVRRDVFGKVFQGMLMKGFVVEGGTYHKPEYRISPHLSRSLPGRHGSNHPIIPPPPLRGGGIDDGSDLAGSDEDGVRSGRDRRRQQP